MGAESESKILVVDDNAANRTLAQATLEEEGYTVILAQGGNEGIRSFERERPDCVLLDVRMPDLDGFEVCARIRELPGGAETPIVFLTALRDVDTFDRALRAGGDDFLTKPVRPTELLVRVQAALKLRRMSADLREHYDLVRRQRDDLMRLGLQKERLSAFVVHDLKNPVSAMDLHAQVLLHDRELPQRAKDTAKHIRSDARALMRLILNLLDISKSEEGKLTARPSRIDLAALVRDAFESLEVKAAAAEVSLTQNLETTAIYADADLIKRVLENLLDNAIRHTPKGGHVSVSSAARGHAIEIAVEDSGAGISPELREKIFEPFVQLEGDHSSTTRSGRGLGLTFCRLAIEAHGGRIWVEDANPGTRFCFELPAEA
ncbi:MAG TPA: hybrid sensor histidine kinase/response regulator [Polyangiaceae bacterium]|nr:hybrid sensor histidine kinase/response regulator [Polyangiaceae bacterium]